MVCFFYPDALFGILLSKYSDVQFCIERIEVFRQSVEQERAKCDSINVDTVKAVGEPPSLRGKENRCPCTSLRTEHHCTNNQQVQSHERLSFVALLKPQLFVEYATSFPETALASLGQSYGHFYLTRLKTELHVMNRMSVDLLTSLQMKGLCEALPQLYSLTSLIVTIPVSTSSVERLFSALKRIKTYSRNRTGQLRLSSLASISI